MKYTTHATVKEALQLVDVEGIIIPGGWNDDIRPELHELLTTMNQDNKFIAAICAEPQYLSNTGILDNKRFTTTLTKEILIQNNKKDLFNWDNFIDENVIKDGHIITAKGRAFIDFGIEIADYYHLFDDVEYWGTKEENKNRYKGF